jgi:hypothetical protein
MTAACSCPHAMRSIPGDLTAQGNQTSMGEFWVRTGTDDACPEHGDIGGPQPADEITAWARYLTGRTGE